MLVLKNILFAVFCIAAIISFFLTLLMLHLTEWDGNTSDLLLVLFLGLLITSVFGLLAWLVKPAVLR